ASPAYLTATSLRAGPTILLSTLWQATQALAENSASPGLPPAASPAASPAGAAATASAQGSPATQTVPQGLIRSAIASSVVAWALPANRASTAAEAARIFFAIVTYPSSSWLSVCAQVQCPDNCASILRNPHTAKLQAHSATRRRTPDAPSIHPGGIESMDERPFSRYHAALTHPELSWIEYCPPKAILSNLNPGAAKCQNAAFSYNAPVAQLDRVPPSEG